MWFTFWFWLTLVKWFMISTLVFKNNFSLEKNSQILKWYQNIIFSNPSLIFITFNLLQFFDFLFDSSFFTDWLRQSIVFDLRLSFPINSFIWSNNQFFFHDFLVFFILFNRFIKIDCVFFSGEVCVCFDFDWSRFKISFFIFYT